MRPLPAAQQLIAANGRFIICVGLHPPLAVIFRMSAGSHTPTRANGLSSLTFWIYGAQCRATLPHADRPKRISTIRRRRLLGNTEHEVISSKPVASPANEVSRW